MAMAACAIKRFSFLSSETLDSAQDLSMKQQVIMTGRSYLPSTWSYGAVNLRRYSKYPYMIDEEVCGPGGNLYLYRLAEVGSEKSTFVIYETLEDVFDFEIEICLVKLSCSASERLLSANTIIQIVGLSALSLIDYH